jgi:predicted anti-sigma-YlaC factor YlaD
LLSLATIVTVKEQNFAEFKELPNKALQIDPETSPENRLVNVLSQRKALWLLEHADDFILETEENATDIEEE